MYVFSSLLTLNLMIMSHKQIHSPVLGSKNPPVTQFMAPGFILSLLFLSSIAPTALTLVLERKDGLLERSLVSGQ
jgi:hypothetical protein